MTTIDQNIQVCWTPETVFSLFQQFPLTETLPLVKAWLAGEGYGVVGCSIQQFREDYICASNCPFSMQAFQGPEECVIDCVKTLEKKLGPMPPFSGKHYHGPDPDKCPAMLKAAKEARDVQRP